MKQTYINFSHDYYKLQFPIFPTIRGKSWFKKINIDDIKDITKQRRFLYKAVIIDKYLMRIKDIPLEFLQWDTALLLSLGWKKFSRITIFSYQEFCDLLNSFIPPFYTQSNIDSEKTIIFLERI